VLLFPPFPLYVAHPSPSQSTLLCQQYEQRIAALQLDFAAAQCDLNRALEELAAADIVRG